MPNISLTYILLIPIGVVLLFRSDWAFYAFMIGVPLNEVMAAGSLTVIRILGLLALISFLVSALLKRRKIKADRMFGVFAIYLFWCTLSYFWSVDPASSLVTIGTIIQLMILYLLIINQIETKSALNNAMIALSIGAAIFAASGLIELSRDQIALQRLLGLAGNPNWYFVIAICMIPALAWLLLNYQNIFIRLFAILVLGTLFITALNTLSRGGLITLGIFMLSYLFFTDKKISWLFILALMVPVGIWIAPPSYVERFTRVGTDPYDRFTVLWPAAWRALNEKIWTGYGMGTSQVVLPQYLGISEIMSPHNSLLAIGIDTGLPGAALYLSCIAIPTFGLLSAIKKRLQYFPRDKLEQFGILLFCVLLAYLGSWFKGGGLEYKNILWVFVGLEASVTNLLMIESKIGKENVNGEKNSPKPIK